ncbi:putative ARCA protein [Rosellinia necatrix]|uniref:Putative ARCA protein n=1 Tax=Rosellinia necatrix TaxID=77044 RepID=A0A1W2TS03_ROSNE|nr:putative ARCA protein [Rosellinia necatrix]
MPNWAVAFGIVESLFDTTDQHRAYQTIVPHEAKKKPLLLNAICTATASYLTILQSTRNPEGVVYYNDIPLPNLNKESTIHYHNACISYMIDYLNDPQDPFDDVLIAIPILRYHEQVDRHLTGSDSETYSNALGAIFRAKQSSFITLLSDISNSSTSLRVPVSKEFALRRSASLIALRQEIWGVLHYRRPFRLSLPVHYSSDLALFQKDDYDDYDWTNHILIWCAYLLKNYYGSESDADVAVENRSRAENWQSLKSFEQQWQLLSPNPFDPIFYQERDPERGQFFPIIWQANDGRVIGMQHIEFGRIVLAVHNLKHHILGVGAAAAARDMESRLRKSTRIICGLALSHRIQPAMTSACAAISLCGEYFLDPREQVAITDLMATIEREYAWSTSSIVESLKRSWSSSRTELGVLE